VTAQPSQAAVREILEGADASAHQLSPLPRLPDAVRERFSRVETWVFDLDNTLYPAGSPVWPMIDERITRWLADLMGIDGMTARGLQKYYYRRYGTTLKGLIEDHGIAPEAFLSFVHDIDRSSLAPNPALVEAVAALPGRKLILTNGSKLHALRTVEQLGFTETGFEAVFDIVAADLMPKPEASTYDRFFKLHDVDPRRAAMFEDLVKNLRVPHERGMATVLVVPPASAGDHREPWERLGADEPFVDVATDDLAGFLVGLELGLVREEKGGTPDPQ
jgi:putative hydrolase of the HAD superfamily